MQLVFTGEGLPEEVTRSIYLAGPTPRFDPNNPNPLLKMQQEIAANIKTGTPVRDVYGPEARKDEFWRYRSIQLLESFGYDGVLFIPEYNPNNPDAHNIEYEDQIQWELDAMNMADVIVFFVPRSLDSLPAFTTNVEFGYWLRSGKIVFGDTPHAEKNRYLKDLMGIDQAGTPQKGLVETIRKATQLTEKSALRTGGERWVPLHIWSTALFQRWYATLKQAGKRCRSAFGWNPNNVTKTTSSSSAARTDLA
jgi:nucleoside 2-deoxyribosyltransferase